MNTRGMKNKTNIILKEIYKVGKELARDQKVDGEYYITIRQLKELILMFYEKGFKKED